MAIAKISHKTSGHTTNEALENSLTGPTTHSHVSVLSSPRKGVKHQRGLLNLSYTHALALCATLAICCHGTHAKTQSKDTPIARLASAIHSTRRRLTNEGDADTKIMDIKEQADMTNLFFKRHGGPSKIGWDLNWGMYVWESIVGASCITVGTLLLIFWPQITFLGFHTVTSSIGIPGESVATIDVLTNTKDTLVERALAYAKENSDQSIFKEGTVAKDGETVINFTDFINEVPVESFCLYIAVMVALITFGACYAGGYKWYWSLIFSVLSMGLGYFLYEGYNLEMVEVAQQLQSTMYHGAHLQMQKVQLEAALAVAPNEMSSPPTMANLESYLEADNFFTKQVDHADAWYNLNYWHWLAVVLAVILVFVIVSGFKRKFWHCEQKVW